MDLHLQRIRKSNGIGQKEMASRVSELMGRPIKVRTYGSWERGEVMMNLEQAYNCCMVLGCTLNDLVGMGKEELKQDELDLVECYRQATPRERRALMLTAETFRDGGLAKSDRVSESGVA